MAQITEQPRVLNRDYRLISEGRHKRYLLVSEAFDARAIKYEDADNRVFAKQRHTQSCPKISALLRFRPRVFRVACRVLDVHDTVFQCYAPRQRAAVDAERVAYQEIPEFRIDVGRGCQMMATRL